MTLLTLLEHIKSLMADNNLNIAFLEVGSNKFTGITCIDEHIGPLSIPTFVASEHAQQLTSCCFIDQIMIHVKNNDCHWTTSGHHTHSAMDYSMSIDQDARIKITLSWKIA